MGHRLHGGGGGGGGDRGADREQSRLCGVVLLLREQAVLAHRRELYELFGHPDAGGGGNGDGG